MKTIFILTAFIVCCILPKGVNAQTVSYGYDAAGNRISRVIVIPALRAADADAPEEQKPYSEMMKDMEIRIYPNPTEGVLKVEISKLPEGKEARFSVYKLSGELLLDRKNSSGYDTLDLTAQPAGSYLLRIVVGEEKSEWKIIKK